MYAVISGLDANTLKHIHELRQVISDNVRELFFFYKLYYMICC